MIKTLNNFLNNFNSYLFVPCCLLSLQLIKYSSFLHHFSLLISNDSFLLYSSSFFSRGGAETARLIFFFFKLKYMNLKFYNLTWLIYFSLFLKIFYEYFYLSLWYVFVLKLHLSLCIYINYDCKSLVKPKKRKKRKLWLFSKKEKEKQWLVSGPIWFDITKHIWHIVPPFLYKYEEGTIQISM